MLSFCQKFRYASERLLQLREEFERASNAARASGEFALMKKLVETFKQRSKEIEKEILWRDEFVLRGVKETWKLCPVQNGIRVLPDPIIWKKKSQEDPGYLFDLIWEPQNYTNRSLSDFGMTREYLEIIKITDTRTQDQLIKQSTLSLEEEPIGKIFDIVDAIQQKRDREKNQDIDTLTTKEVFEAIDAAGYRPATLIELLAYAKYHWKPEWGHQLTQEVKDQKVNTGNVFAFGSPFLFSSGELVVPYLSGTSFARVLLANDFVGDWRSNICFLVFRK